MEILKDYDLTKFNTFGISARAKLFAEVKSEADLLELFKLSDFQNNEKLFLGGGSNVLLTRDFPGIVVVNKIKGVDVLEENDESVLIRSRSGEVWHDLVNLAVGKGWWGIENLSFIPGTVGAAPMQNIGAYGVELKSVLENVETFEVSTGTKRVFTPEECELGYRDSIFKNALKDKYFILAITLRLSKKENKNITYRVLKEHIEKNNLEIKESKDVSDAVTAIRKSKLPDPAVIGNAGSFFKNVFLDKTKMEEMKKLYGDMPTFTEGDTVKVPAAWLIEHCGWKGKRMGNTGVHDKQALILVNHGGATGAEIKNLAEEIIDSVYKKFGIKLETEVNLV